MAIEKLNMTFVSKHVLESEEMNTITGKVDEIITSVNSQEVILGESVALLDELNGEVV